jgi:hypothetical protein
MEADNHAYFLIKGVLIIGFILCLSPIFGNYLLEYLSQCLIAILPLSPIFMFKNIFITFYLSILLCSCVSQSEHDKIISEKDAIAQERDKFKRN